MTDYKELISGMMGKKRYIHSCNVADMCVKLAEINGEDTEKAYIAGILHDIRKEADDEDLVRELRLSGYYIDPVELASKKTWHGIAAAYYVKVVLGIDDEDILNAIRFHTVGRADMSRLEKIVYLGDLVSAERSYPNVEKYRKYALENLDLGMYKALEWLIPDFVEKGRMIPVSTLEAYNCYLNIAGKTK
ncbi:MAG: bis(5'-nucleosyl)-tetraphosphatase (symmetrical) YqeK [Ruminiclostridium sp.]|nr:bis(5'-nucleosyl)-tetraphosphatase (symmetrical) YqeK [Ruminiclostridium sp.]